MEQKPSKRLFSLDVFRGMTMFLLIAEAAGFHHSFYELVKDTPIISSIGNQLLHHPWHGFRFWDLIQPFFMFIVGVAMPFSIGKRLKTGNRKAVTRHILQRCFLLFAFGVLLHCVYSHALVWELWNVLVQLACIIVIAYAIMNLSNRNQLIISLALLALTELLYRFYDPVTPFNNGASFGSFMDRILMGKINGDGWVTINFIPTAAHTIWGVVCGRLLLNKSESSQKLKAFVLWGSIAVVLGIMLDVLNITPVIKRLATSSFTLLSGGIAVLVLALFYWLIDAKENAKKWMWIFSVVGTNSIFIYLFTETVGIQWFRGFGKIFTHGILDPLGIRENSIMVINSLFVLLIFWYLTYFLDKKKIYFKV